VKENGGPSVGTPFGTIRVLVLDIELFLKAIHTPACIYQLLLAGKEGMAVAANFVELVSISAPQAHLIVVLL
jgi:hypothetical protein